MPRISCAVADTDVRYRYDLESLTPRVRPTHTSSIFPTNTLTRSTEFQANNDLHLPISRFTPSSSSPSVPSSHSPPTSHCSPHPPLQHTNHSTSTSSIPIVLTISPTSLGEEWTTAG